MSSPTQTLTCLDNYVHDLTRVVRAACSDADKIVQCYVAGELVDWRRPAGGLVEFVLPDPGAMDVVALLAVESDQAAVNLWSDAMAGLAGGQRIALSIALTMSLGVDATVRVLLGSEGNSAADQTVLHCGAFPGGRGAGGWGLGLWGEGGLGWDGSNCPGWGYGGGLGEFGFDCRLLRWQSDPLPPGIYPLAVCVEDEDGAVLACHDALQRVDSPARPAADLRVQSYDPAQDIVTLTWTQSPDIG